MRMTKFCRSFRAQLRKSLVNSILAGSLLFSAILIIQYGWLTYAAIARMVRGGNGLSPYTALVGAGMLAMTAMTMVYTYLELSYAEGAPLWVWYADSLVRFLVVILNFMYYIASKLEVRSSWKKNSLVRNLIYGRLESDD